VFIDLAPNLNIPGGTYIVTKKLPESNGEYAYRVRGVSEQYERVVRESELKRVIAYLRRFLTLPNSCHRTILYPLDEPTLSALLATCGHFKQIEKSDIEWVPFSCWTILTLLRSCATSVVSV
jgi:hypothetical protein